jgi:hypothetical protein
VPAPLAIMKVFDYPFEQLNLPANVYIHQMMIHIQPVSHWFQEMLKIKGNMSPMLTM